MRISDWSSDVCSSDLITEPPPDRHEAAAPDGGDPEHASGPWPRERPRRDTPHARLSDQGSRAALSLRSDSTDRSHPARTSRGCRYGVVSYPSLRSWRGPCSVPAPASPLPPPADHDRTRRNVPTGHKTQGEHGSGR